jgi:hypothetical protein
MPNCYCESGGGAGISDRQGQLAVSLGPAYLYPGQLVGVQDWVGRLEVPA